MPPSRWPRIQDALWQAIEREPDAREAFLTDYCAGDSELLAEVHALLEAHQRAGDFLGGSELRRDMGALLHLYERGLGTPTARETSPGADPFLSRTVSHYQIFEKLGEGGMGVVYKARDTRLDRVVALKFPAPHLSGDGDAKARLIREARAASALDHVNICTIHEIGETDAGQIFIAMACYDGETLDRRLRRSRLPIDEILGYAVEVARGLSRAHEQGIVHRDIKPANVMITVDSVVKLLDFGLASAADERLLEVGAVRATPAYMSPEQARGEPVDHRTDIWSLGATIYEMLMGRRPFPGTNAQAVVDGILNHEPGAVAMERPEVPGRLERIVSRALSKRPAERYGDVRELLDDLLRVRRRSPGWSPLPDIRVPASRGTRARGQLLPGGERVQATAVVWALKGGRDRRTVAQVSAIVRRNGGVVQPGGAEEIVALFGIPTPQEDDCVRAARSALEVGAWMSAGGFTGRPELGAGAGIDTGLVLAHEPRETGQPHRAVGSPLRFAALLARHAKTDEILAGRNSLRLLERFFETEPGAPIRRPDSGRVMVPARIVEESSSSGRLDVESPAGLSEYVGRGMEAETLRRCLRQAAAGEGQLVTVMGEAGLGKSRLLHEFRTRLERERVTILQGRCTSRTRHHPFQPFIEALQDHLRLRSHAPGRCRPDVVVARIREVAPELETYVPLYLHLLSIPSEAHPLPKHLEGEPLHRVLVKALAAVLTLSARQDPLVLLLDDWHWSDPASRDVLEQLVELIPGYPILVVVTFRPEYGPAWPQPPYQTTIRLQPLDEGASTRIIEAVLHAEDFPRDAAASFHERTGGNPFFLEEICRTLLEDGTLRVEDGRAIPISSLEKLILPSTIQAVIRTRLHRLDPATRFVLRMASVLGRTFNRDLLEHALRSEPGTGATLGPSLEALHGAGLICRTHVLPEATYRFNHVLTQEAAYDGLLEHQRRRAHRLVGQVIEERCSERLEEHAEVLAHHFGEAQDWRKRVHYSRLAGEWSFRLGQHSRAIALHEQAREALNRLPKDAERQATLVELLLRQERLCEATAGHRTGQQAAIDELLMLLAGDADSDADSDVDVAPDTLAEVHVRQGDLHIIAGRFGQAEEVLGEALRISRRQGSVPLEQMALRSMSFLRWHQDRHEEALFLNTELVALDRQRGDSDALVTDLLNLLTVLKRMKDFDRAQVCVEELLALGEQLEDPARLMPLYNNVAEFYRALGDVPRALSFLERASEASERLPFLGGSNYQLTLRAQIHFEQGRMEESIRCYQEVIDIHRAEQSTSGAAKSPHAPGLAGLAGALRTLGEILVVLQRGEEAIPYLQEAAAHCGVLGDSETEALLRSRVAVAHEEQERYGRAQLEWEQVAALCRSSRDPGGESRAMEGQGRIARRQGEIERAISSYRDALRLAEAAGDEVKQGELHNTLGILAWHRQAYEDALMYYQHALGIYEERDDPAHAGHVLASIGATLLKLEKPEEALQRLEEAIQMHRRGHQRQLEAYALGVMGDVHLSVGRHTEALTCFGESLRLRLEIDDRKGEGWMLLRLARVHDVLGQRDRSRTTAARAAAIAVEIGDEELTNGCRSLAGSLAPTANPEP
jgi:tetratricopeptide (TPR) repeat protein